MTVGDTAKQIGRLGLLLFTVAGITGHVPASLPLGFYALIVVINIIDEQFDLESMKHSFMNGVTKGMNRVN